MNRVFALRITVAAVIGLLLGGVLYFTPRLAPRTAQSFTLVLKSSALVSGPSLITVNEGDLVTLHVKSDQSGQLMIHGYEHVLAGRDKELTIGDDGGTTLTFVASKSGRYMIHLHREDQHVEVAQIDVQPR